MEDIIGGNFRKRNRSALSLTPSPLSQNPRNPRKILKMTDESMDSAVATPEMPSEWSTLSESEKLDRLMLKLLVVDKNMDSIL